MISKVFEKNKKTRSEYVIDYQDDYEFQDIVEKGKSGKCGRCGRTYQYGDNKKNPTSCPYCVCVDCHTSIMHRKNYFYSEKIIRCYNCYSLRRYGRSSYRSGYDIDYDHEYPTSSTTVRKRVPIKKEIKVEKKIEYEVLEEVKVKDEHYESYLNNIEKDKNRLIENNLNVMKPLSDYFKNKNFLYITDSDISKDKEWYHTASIGNLKDSLIAKHDGFNTIPIKNIHKFNYDDKVNYNKEKEVECLSPIGYYPNIAAYLQGQPYNMINYELEKEPVVVKHKTIYFNLAVDSSENEKQYKNRGIITFSIIQELIKKNYDVDLILLDASFTKENTLIQKMVLSTKQIKENLDVIYNMLTSIEYYRVIVQDEKIDFLKHKKLFSSWERGSGFVLKTNDLKRVMNFKKTDLIIGSPSELKIDGDNLELDYQNTLKYLSLRSSV